MWYFYFKWTQNWLGLNYFTFTLCASASLWSISKISRRRQWQPTPVLLPGESHGRRSLVGCGPWGCEESDTTEQLHFHFSLSRIGEGNGNPLQCSCLENPRDRGAWWAAVYGVAQSQTLLKRLSSSSSSSKISRLKIERSPIFEGIVNNINDHPNSIYLSLDRSLI